MDQDQGAEHDHTPYREWRHRQHRQPPAEHGGINLWAVGTAVVGTVLSAAVMALAGGAIFLIVKMPQEQEKLRDQFHVYSAASTRRLERLEASDRNQELQLTRIGVEMNLRLR